MRTLILASLLLVAPRAHADAPPPPNDAQAGPWQFVKQADGIVVDRRVVAGSSLKEFRGKGEIDAPVASILAVFADVPRATEWMDSCNGSHAVRTISERELIVYNRTHAPWPVSDRDVVLHDVVSFDDKARKVQLDFWSVTDDKAPPVNGVVRMPSLHGHWTLWPSTDGRTTRVEYQVHANPGGRLPDWIVNYVSRELPHRTIAGLRAQVKRRSYPEFEKLMRAKLPYDFLWPSTVAQH
jgi:hypothetical protein